MQGEIGCRGKGYCYGSQVEVYVTMCAYTKTCTWIRRVYWSQFGRNPIVSFCSIYVTVCLSSVPRQSIFLDFACLFIYRIDHSPELFICLSIYKNAETCPQCQNPFFQSLETKLRFPVWTVYCPQKNCECFLFATEKHNFFFDRLKRLLAVQILEVTVYQENCRTYTFNNFSLAKWESRNGGDLFGRVKIDTAKSCIQLLQIVLLYRGHLYKELCPGIFRYSKEWKSFTIDIVTKSA